MNGISRVLQKLLKYFNGAITWTVFVFIIISCWTYYFCLNLNEALLPGKLSRTPASVKPGSSL